MSKIIETLLGSILITVFTIALMIFSALHYVFKAGGIIDCEWHASARTWIDLNRDGFVNNDELPLGNVKIYVDDVKNQRLNIGWPAISNKDGDVQLNVSMPGCPDVDFEVYVAETPEGYRLTTEPRLELNRGLWESLDSNLVYYFGFIPEQ
jgi:hypothetical protein